MPSTYTLNNGIELIGTGEQSGTWGDTTNTNLELLDTALDGQVSVTLAATGSSGSPNTLPISDGASSNGRNRLVIFGDGGDLGGTAFVQLTPNDAEKIIYVRNNLSGSRSILLFQGTYSASNDYEVPAGTTAVVFFNGAGTGAVAANVFNNAFFDSLRLGSVSVDKILDEDNMASDDAAALATQQSIKAYVDSQVGTVDTLAEILANGNTTGGTNILFGDSDKAIFGAGSDLQIYHDPSGPSSLISDQGAGDLILRGSNQIRFQDATGAEHYAIFNENGAVQLYYDQGTYSDYKLATTSTGVDITGTAVTDGLTVAGNVSVDGGTIKLDGNYPNGTGNVALGDTALDTLTTGGNYNLALGHNNSTALTTGDNNVSLGAFALTSATTSSSNTAVGYSSLELNETGAGNVALGNKSMEEGVTADNNTAVGNQAGRFLSDEIVATSIVSGVNYTIQTLGTTDFTLIGASSNTVGSTFTATGAGSGTGTASANVSLNTLVGYKSGELIVGGSKNSILGGFDGNQGSIDIRNSDNNIVLSDGDGNPRLAYVSANAELVINESSYDADFRVESDGASHMLFVDAGNNRVAVGTATPDVPFHVSSSSTDIVKLTTESTTVGPNLLFANTDGTLARLASAETNTLRIETGTSNTEMARFVEASGTVFNEGSNAALDFRVEGDTNSNLFVVDAGLNQVGVGSAPDGSATLDVVGRTLRAANIYTKWAQYAVPTATFVDVYWNDDTITLDTGHIYRFQLSTVSTGTNTGVIYWVWFDDSTWHVDIESRNGTSSNNPQGRVDSSKFQIYHNHGSTYTIAVQSEARAMGTDDNTRSSIGLPGFITAYGNDALVFNEDAADLDFRVESNSNTHMLFVDAGASKVSINTSSTSNGILSVYSPTTYGKIFMSDSTLGYGYGAFIQGYGVSGSGGYFQLGSVDANTQTVAMQVNQQATSISFLTRDGASGSSASRLILDQIGGNGAVFNETGQDYDFRVESDSNTHALFVDAGTSGVGIGNTANANAHLNVDGTITGGYGSFIRMNNTGTNGCSGFIGCTDGNWSIGQEKLIIGRSAQGNAPASAYAEITISGSEVVFNENSNDRDFRVEGASDANMLVVNAGQNVVCIGDSIGGTGIFSVPKLHIDCQDTTNGIVTERARQNYTCYGAAMNDNTGTVYFAYMVNGSDSNVGSIVMSSSGVTYNTTSDYRLKENVVDLTGATERVKQLAPKQFNFIEDEGDTVVDGFLAHEAQTVVPEAVHGTHNEVDAEGKPVYQSIDQSKLVPLLTAALQEAITKIEDLETRIAALETP